jgi:hypothetical protein
MDCSTESTGSVLDDAGSLILLLRLMTILNNRNGDTSLPGFKQDATIGGPSEPLPFDEADFIPLDAVSAILVQQHEVIAVGYQQNTLSNVAFNRDRTADRIPGMSTIYEAAIVTTIRSGSTTKTTPAGRLRRPYHRTSAPSGVQTEFYHNG